ncbi:hypothetical protein PLICRDRAFT_145303 [Plicaturopsis crispa FD-325 SS-3]|nr:hypothetical protein PLICRDRAFT_145303 [Plicaturopsis crispa FD-325 SS-3]
MSSQGVSLVTGAAQGIGRAIALRLADDGFDVAVNDIAAKKVDLESLRADIEKKGRKSRCVFADVSVEEQVKTMIDTVVAELGGLDVMVANAGVITWAPFFDTSVADWDRIFNVNVKGVMLCYKYAGQRMVAQGRGGRIIGASSVGGKKGFELGSAYCASKFAVRGLSQSVASALGKYGITVNTYAPGAIYTPMLQSMEEATVEMGAAPGSFLDAMAKGSVVGHTGTAEDIASLVSYIASKEAHFITGQSLTCDGGYHFD